MPIFKLELLLTKKKEYLHKNNIQKKKNTTYANIRTSFAKANLPKPAALGYAHRGELELNKNI